MEKARITKNKEFNEMYIRYKDHVYRIALHYTDNDNGAAEEVMQNVFLELLICIKEIREETVESWLSILTKNMALNYLGKANRENPFGEIDILENCQEVDKAAESYFNEKERRRLLLEFSEKLFSDLKGKNERWYEAFCLLYGLEKSLKETAEIMGISVQVLNALLYRARKWTQEKYKKEYENLIEE